MKRLNFISIFFFIHAISFGQKNVNVKWNARIYPSNKKYIEVLVDCRNNDCAFENVFFDIEYYNSKNTFINKERIRFTDPGTQPYLGGYFYCRYFEIIEEDVTYIKPKYLHYTFGSMGRIANVMFDKNGSKKEKPNYNINDKYMDRLIIGKDFKQKNNNSDKEFFKLEDYRIVIKNEYDSTEKEKSGPYKPKDQKVTKKPSKNEEN